MQTSVTFKNLDSSDTLRSYVQEKLDRFDRLLDNPAEANVVLSVEKFRVAVSKGGCRPPWGVGRGMWIKFEARGRCACELRCVVRLRHRVSRHDRVNHLLNWHPVWHPSAETPRAIQDNPLKNLVGARGLEPRTR